MSRSVLRVWWGGASCHAPGFPLPRFHRVRLPCALRAGLSGLGLYAHDQRPTLLVVTAFPNPTHHLSVLSRTPAGRGVPAAVVCTNTQRRVTGRVRAPLCSRPPLSSLGYGISRPQLYSPRPERFAEPSSACHIPQRARGSPQTTPPRRSPPWLAPGARRPTPAPSASL